MKIVSVFYDNWCPNCSRFVRIVSKFDWFNLIEYKELRNLEQLSRFKDIDIVLAKEQMASYSNEWNYGYVSLYFIFLRIPLLWILFPLFYFLKVTKIGQHLYVQLALKRKVLPLHCDSNSCNV
jgi:predicted DCC family thiol-disulfide oxidoreductase YuxK